MTCATCTGACREGRDCPSSTLATRALFGLAPLRPEPPLQPASNDQCSERFHRLFDLTRAIDNRRGQR